MSEGALRGLVVLELATGVAGPYVGRLLADLGAQVVKVEPADGDPTRHEPPFIEDESAFFAWLNRGKFGVQLDDDSLDSLLAHADIVLHDRRGAAADALEARALRLRLSVVVLSLSPYGRSGERSGWLATPLTEYATGGYHYFGGDPSREPIALPGYQVEFHAGMHGAVAVLAGYWHALRTGEGQRIELSHQEAILSDHAWLTTIWTHTGQVQRRTGSAFVRCADGYLYLFPLVPYSNLFVLMERFDLLADEELQQPLVWQQRFPEVLAAFAEWAASRRRDEVYHACQELRIAVSPVNTFADVVASPQLAARQWFQSLPVGGSTVVGPGVPYRLSETPCRPEGRAPRLGEHTNVVLDHCFPWANASQPSPVAGAAGSVPAHGPLEGLRVIEVTANWAGPIAGRHLADLGADVIKIELQTKPATRALVYVGGDLWPEHYHRSGYFNKLNRNKRAICLDLSKPRGRETFLRLARIADVVIENNAARVMGNLGLDWPVLREVNPRLVMCSMSGFGATGPERNYSAYGSNVETVSGLASVLGYGPNEYFGTGSYYADPVTGTHGVVAILAALIAARRTGRGQWIDMALLEAVLPFFAQQLLEYTVTGRVPQPMANRSPRWSPQGVYPSAGTDCWLALTVRNESEWQALCRLIGRLDLASDPDLASAEGRRLRAEEIDDAIATWSRSLDHLAAAEALQKVGVPAAPVMANWELFCDNHLNDRGFFVDIRHPKAGTHRFPGFPWRFERTPATIRRPAPLFAEHNHEVFSDLLGFSEEEVEALYHEGVTADAPLYLQGPTL